MSGLAVQRPSAIARFPPEEVQDWLDQLQRKIQRGLHPQPEPEPSPEPDSPNNDGRSQAGSPASVDSPRQAQKAVTDNRDVFMAEQPEAEATPRDENDDAGTDGEDHVYEGSAADEELDSSSSAVLYESDDQGEEGEGDEEEEESYGYDGGEVIPVDDVDYLESDGDNAEENENGVEEIEDEDIEDMEYDGDEQEYPEEEDDEDEEAYDQRSPDDGQGEIGSLDAMQHESEDDFYGNDDPDVQGSDVLEDQPYADGDERYSAEPEQPETWAPVDETAGVFAENPAYGWGAAPQPMMGPAHAPDAIDTARPVADQWTQSSPLSAQIPNDLDIQTAPNLYPSLPRQPEEPVQTSGLYPPLPAFSTDPATEAPLEEQNVQPLLPDTQLDPALIDPSLLEFMAQHLEAASSVGTPIPPSIYQNPRGGYQVLRANEWPVTATAFSYGDLSGQDGGMDRLEDLSGEDDPNAESGTRIHAERADGSSFSPAVDDGVKEGDEEMSNQTDEASDDEEDANLLGGSSYTGGVDSPADMVKMNPWVTCTVKEADHQKSSKFRATTMTRMMAMKMTRMRPLDLTQRRPTGIVTPNRMTTNCQRLAQDRPRSPSHCTSAGTRKTRRRTNSSTTMKGRRQKEASRGRLRPRRQKKRRLCPCYSAPARFPALPLSAERPCPRSSRPATSKAHLQVRTSFRTRTQSSRRSLLVLVIWNRSRKRSLMTKSQHRHHSGLLGKPSTQRWPSKRMFLGLCPKTPCYSQRSRVRSRP